MPARGAVAGVKADIQAMKEGKYDPRGHGNAFTHNFLNQSECLTSLITLHNTEMHWHKQTVLYTGTHALRCIATLALVSCGRAAQSHGIQCESQW